MSDPVPSAKREPTPFERMQALATRVLAVPKVEVDRRQEQWREQKRKAEQRKTRSS